MKTNLVLPMDALLDQCCVVAGPTPPTLDARHIPATAADNARSSGETHGCRCDRWGHPCPGCLKLTPPTRTAVSDFSPENEGGE